MPLDKRERQVLINLSSCTTTILETPVFYTPKNVATACPPNFVHAFFLSQYAYQYSDWRFLGRHSQTCTQRTAFRVIDWVAVKAAAKIPSPPQNPPRQCSSVGPFPRFPCE
jgi:hypothetical protein